MTEIVGSPTPRLYTSPLSDSSRGPELVAFAKSIGVDLLPWQCDVANRALETMPDGSYRFRTVVILVGRQSGKTTLAKTLSLWRMQEAGSLVLGAAQSMDISREAWQGACDLALDNELPVKQIRRGAGDICLLMENGSRYRIVATSAGAGRGLSVDLLVMDEARMQRDWLAWSALSKTTIARPGSQIWVISNAGDDESVVLNSLREKGLSGDDGALGVFEWSADPLLDIGDPEGWAQGCPGIGHTVPLAAVEAAFGTDPPAVFRTEIRCERVVSMDGAVDPAAWQGCMDESVTLDKYRHRVVLGVDTAADGSHTSLVAAVVDDRGLVRVEAITGWSSLQEAATALPGWVERVRPLATVWFPGGPAQRLGVVLRQDTATELKGLEVTEACMSFADAVAAMRVRHAGDALLSSHVLAAVKHRQGDVWRFERPASGGNVDAAWAAAGAVLVARRLAAAPVRSPVFVL